MLFGLDKRNSGDHILFRDDLLGVAFVHTTTFPPDTWEVDDAQFDEGLMGPSLSCLARFTVLDLHMQSEQTDVVRIT